MITRRLTALTGGLCLMGAAVVACTSEDNTGNQLQPAVPAAPSSAAPSSAAPPSSVTNDVVQTPVPAMPMPQATVPGQSMTPVAPLPATGSPSPTGTAAPPAVNPFPCAATAVDALDITNFEGLVMDQFASSGTLSGGVFGYGVPTATDTGAFVAAGNVANYSGFGVWLAGCMDASAYTGVSFTIGGNAGAAGTLTLRAQTNGTYMVGGDAGTELKGGCVYAAETSKYSDCVHNAVSVPITETPTTVSFSWAEFTGGKPEGVLNPAELLGFQFEFAWTEAAMPYDVSVTVDDLSFFSGQAPVTPPAPMAGAGAGGAMAMGGAGGMGNNGGMGGAMGGSGGAAAPAGPDFAMEVHPILVAKCGLSGCHDGGNMKAAFGSPMAAIAEEEFKGHDTEFEERLFGDDVQENRRMPPVNQVQLTDEEKPIIRAWIDAYFAQ